jgi:hypothetical protein
MEWAIIKIRLPILEQSNLPPDMLRRSVFVESPSNAGPGFLPAALKT